MYEVWSRPNCCKIAIQRKWRSFFFFLSQEQGGIVCIKNERGLSKLRLGLGHLCLEASLPACSSCLQNNVTPSEVTQWTNHRVMEWLRSVDLAEYAPNLRGSGVHGGLMVRYSQAYLI